MSRIHRLKIYRIDKNGPIHKTAQEVEAAWAVSFNHETGIMELPEGWRLEPFLEDQSMVRIRDKEKGVRAILREIKSCQVVDPETDKIFNYTAGRLALCCRYRILKSPRRGSFVRDNQTREDIYFFDPSMTYPAQAAWLLRSFPLHLDPLAYWK